MAYFYIDVSRVNSLVTCAIRLTVLNECKHSSVIMQPVLAVVSYARPDRRVSIACASCSLRSDRQFMNYVHY